MLVHYGLVTSLGDVTVQLSETKACPGTGKKFVRVAKEAAAQGQWYTICRLYYKVKKEQKKEFFDANFIFSHWNKVLKLTHPTNKMKVQEAYLFVMKKEDDGFVYQAKITSLPDFSLRSLVTATSLERTPEVLEARKACLSGARAGSQEEAHWLRSIAKDFPEDDGIYKDHLDFFLEKEGGEVTPSKKNKRFLSKIIYRFPTLEKATKCFQKLFLVAH